MNFSNDNLIAKLDASSELLKATRAQMDLAMVKAWDLYTEGLSDLRDARTATTEDDRAAYLESAINLFGMARKFYNLLGMESYEQACLDRKADAREVVKAPLFITLTIPPAVPCKCGGSITGLSQHSPVHCRTLKTSDLK